MLNITEVVNITNKDSKKTIFYRFVNSAEVVGLLKKTTIEAVDLPLKDLVPIILKSTKTFCQEYEIVEQTDDKLTLNISTEVPLATICRFTQSFFEQGDMLGGVW